MRHFIGYFKCGLLTGFNRNIPFLDNPNFINVEGQELTLIENDQKLKGNLENVDEKKPFTPLHI